MTAEKRAPVQGEHHRGANWRFKPGTISWSEHVEAHTEYVKRYGNDQSAERIAERCGFSYGELVMFLGREPTTYVPFDAEECKGKP